MELLEVSPDSNPGDRIFTDAYKGQPERTLNPKKELWKLVAVELEVSPGGRAVYMGKELLAKGENPLTAPTLHKCQIG